MSVEMSQWLKEFQWDGVNSENEISAAESALGTTFPEEYRTFLAEFGSGEGFIGEHYLIIWSANDLHRLNEDYEVRLYAPGFLMFASNGGGEGFAFDLRDAGRPIAMLPFVGLDAKHARVVARTFNEFLRRLKESDGESL